MKSLLFFLLMFALSFTTTGQRRQLVWGRVMADGTPSKYAGWDANGDPVELNANTLTSTQIGFGNTDGTITSSSNLVYSTTLGFRVRQVSTNTIALFQNSSGGTVLSVGDGLSSFTGTGGRIVYFDMGDVYSIYTSNVEVAQETFSIKAGNGNATANSGDHISFAGGTAETASGADGGNITLSPGLGDGAGSNGNIIFSNIPTADPCATAAAGTVWSDAGTLKVCP